MRSVDLRSMQVLVTVFDKGNMTLAARALGMTQSAVSQHVKHIEAVVGTVLVDRALRPLRPTPAGMILYQRGKRILAEVEQASMLARMTGSSRVPQLRLGVIYSLARTFVIQLVRTITRNASPSNLMIWTNFDLEHGRAFLNRELDLIITANPLEDQSGLERHALVEEPFGLVLPRKFALSGTRPDLKSLAAKLPFIRYGARSFIGMQVERHLRWMRIEAPQQYEFDDSDTVLEMVGEGMGWAVMSPLGLLHGRADLQKVRVLPFPGPELRRRLMLAARADEFARVPEMIANLGRDILRKHYVPQLHALSPWLADEVAISEPTALGHAGLIAERAARSPPLPGARAGRDVARAPLAATPGSHDAPPGGQR